MNDFYLTAYVVAFGAVFVPAAILYVALRHCFAGDASGNDEPSGRDGDNR